MLVHPVRKDLITEPPASFLLHNNSFTHIQDDQLPPELLHEAPLQHLFHQQPPQQLHYQHQRSLQSPFQHTVDFHFYSPPSSASASPTSSPTFSSTHSPATAVSTDFQAAFDGGFVEAPSMSTASSYNPAIRVHQLTSSPLRHYPHSSQYHTGSPMLAQHAASGNHSWEGDANVQLLSPAARVQNGLSRRTGLQNNNSNHHKKAAGDALSPLTAGAPSGYNSQQTTSSFSPTLNGFENHHTPSTSSVSKPLPTPVQTPVQNSFLAAPFQNYDPSSQDGDNAEAEMAMRRAVLEQQQQQQQQQYQHQHQQQHPGTTEEEAPFHYSLAPSVSSLSHNSPATPQTTYDDLDDGSKAMTHGEDRFPDVDRWMDEYLRLDALSDFNGGQNATSVPIPKLNRTISDIYQDELYNTGIIPTPQVRKQPTSQNLLTAPTYHSLVADRLQAARQGHLSARSQSPATSINRDRSPFRQGSPLAADFNTAPLQQPNLASNMQLSQNGMNIGQHDNQGEPKTISPKDALLEYHEGTEDAGMPPLFPTNGTDFQIGDTTLGGLRRESSNAFQPTQNYNPMEAFPTQYAQQAANMRQYNFMQQQHQQQHPRRQPQQQQQNNLMHHTPEFPASLPTMESTTSETQPTIDITSAPQGQQPMTTQAPTETIQRPDSTASDSGTYTCTYHGCTLRFETPAKLQKHKREAHRSTTPGGHLAGRDGTLAMRNSQAGPHKCERINPSTGKPCNSIFSRPYDLTRHEDTIHNARKQKVRCHLCTEEKTFSRNDALTRHMRVVHPEVDWPGKQKRKGRD
ncbi:hypothetical protein VTN00DRAFT_9361 [Thermoascus crustaceus]|uniref:uncharacterized protein n=1 Tax=Thermoascus crustaceus TaxID=5088 RepID=UPI003744642C